MPKIRQIDLFAKSYTPKKSVLQCKPSEVICFSIATAPSLPINAALLPLQRREIGLRTYILCVRFCSTSTSISALRTIGS